MTNVVVYTSLPQALEVKAVSGCKRRGKCSWAPSTRAATAAWIPGVAWSDHLSFWRCGYKALMVTDTAFYRYPHYHAATDRADQLDYPALAAVTAGLGKATADLASGR
jgi:hypothetical protein